MSKNIEAFGSGGEPIPDKVERFTEPVEVAPSVTPESVHEDGDLQSKLPKPTGYRILILPFSPKQKTKGGIYLHDSVLEKERIGTNVGYVVALGPDAYRDSGKFPEGAWCKPKDWVIFGRYAGARLKIEGGELRLLNDDEVLAVISDPEDIQSV